MIGLTVKRVIFGLLVSYSLIHVNLNAQSSHFNCGVDHETTAEMIIRLKENKEAIKNGLIQLRNDIVYVPIKFHLVGRDDGSQRVSESNVLDMLCATNEDYADQGIQFYIKGDFNYIDSDAVYEDHQQTQRGVMSFSKDNQAINVFLLERVSQNPFVGGYYTSRYDWIVIRNSDVNSSYVMTHEIGHFFTLPHPFQGWDATGFEPTEVGEKCPEISPSGIPSEKADGSNCEDAGDFICDTPADYNAFGSVCNPAIPILDPDSVEIAPERSLFMGYFQCVARSSYFFTETQKDLINADLGSGRRRSLVAAEPTTTAIVEASPSNISPRNQEIVNVTNDVTFRWSAVENANRYLVEIDLLPNFSSPALITIITNENSVDVPGLVEESNYFWRVLPFNEYSTCSGFGQRTVFRTTLDFAVSNNSVEAIEEWTVFPNPVKDSYVQLSIQSTERINGIIQIIDNAGREVFSRGNLEIQPGQNTINLNIADLTGGVYSIAFRSDKGNLTDRLVVLQ